MNKLRYIMCEMGQFDPRKHEFHAGIKFIFIKIFVGIIVRDLFSFMLRSFNYDNEFSIQ